jgi:hypothetical protein
MEHPPKFLWTNPSIQRAHTRNFPLDSITTCSLHNSFVPKDPCVGVDLQDLVMRTKSEGVTLFLWLVGPHRQHPIRGTQNEIRRDLTTPKIGSDSLMRTAAERLHCLHRYSITSSSSTTSSPKPSEPSSPTPAPHLVRVCLQVSRCISIPLSQIELRLKTIHRIPKTTPYWFKS